MSSLKTPSVPAVERTLAVFEVLASSHSGVPLSDLVRRLGVPKSSLHCLLLTLERSGYVNRSEKTGKYALGWKVAALANAALSGLKLRELATPHLRSLSLQTRLTVHMGILEHGEVLLVDKFACPDTTRISTWPGKRMDMHCTAIGKALIASLPDGQIDGLVRERPLFRHNDNTIVALRRLKEELARVRQMGYAVDDEEEEIGSRCIGAPVLSSSGTAVAAISLSGTTSQITPENLPPLASLIKSTAARIAEDIQLGEVAAERSGSERARSRCP